MSIHSSFGKGTATQRHRSVVKRYEKIKILKDKGKWDEEQGVLGLPKVKMIKIRAKKEKIVKAESAEGAEGAAPAEGAAAPAKGDAKGAAPKAGSKKK
jgi:small basic protein (TIGR04137 family)